MNDKVCRCGHHKVKHDEGAGGKCLAQGYGWKCACEKFEAAQQGVQADALPCGHNQGIEFGESSWSCVRSTRAPLTQAVKVETDSQVSSLLYICRGGYTDRPSRFL